MSTPPVTPDALCCGILRRSTSSAISGVCRNFGLGTLAVGDCEFEYLVG